MIVAIFVRRSTLRVTHRPPSHPTGREATLGQKYHFASVLRLKQSSTQTSCHRADVCRCSTQRDVHSDASSDSKRRARYSGLSLPRHGASFQSMHGSGLV